MSIHGRWRYQPLPKGIPGIDLEARRLSLTLSPPPGRPDRTEDDRKRQHSGSDADESAKKPKTVVDRVGDKQGDMVRSKECEQVGDKKDGQVEDREGAQDRASGTEAVENAGNSISETLVTKSLDPGSFTNQEAYSPLTPAKTKNIPDISVIINSPVFHSKARNIQA